MFSPFRKVRSKVLRCVTAGTTCLRITTTRCQSQSAPIVYVASPRLAYRYTAQLGRDRISESSGGSHQAKLPPTHLVQRYKKKRTAGAMLPEHRSGRKGAKSNSHVENLKSLRGREKILRTYHLILPKSFFSPSWKTQKTSQMF